MNKKIVDRSDHNYNRLDISDQTDKVVISSEYYEDDRPVFMCSFCNQTLTRLTDAGQNNTAFWCRNCSVEFDPENENVRRESKLSVPDRNIEPAVATTPEIDYNTIAIDKEVEIKGGLKALKEKGLKITDYKEDIPRPKRK